MSISICSNSNNVKSISGLNRSVCSLTSPDIGCLRVDFSGSDMLTDIPFFHLLYLASRSFEVLYFVASWSHDCWQCSTYFRIYNHITTWRKGARSCQCNQKASLAFFYSRKQIFPKNLRVSLIPFPTDFSSCFIGHI